MTVVVQLAFWLYLPRTTVFYRVSTCVVHILYQLALCMFCRFSNAAKAFHLDKEDAWISALDKYQGFTIYQNPVERFVSAFHEEVGIFSSSLQHNGRSSVLVVMLVCSRVRLSSCAAYA